MCYGRQLSKMQLSEPLNIFDQVLNLGNKVLSLFLTESNWMIVNTIPSTNSSNLVNIGILFRVRLIAIISQSFLILFSISYLDIMLPLGWLISILTIESLFEWHSYRLVMQAKPQSSVKVFVHIGLDSLILAGLVYFAGGANNPFIYLLLLSVALGSFMLSPRYLLMVTVLQLSLYSLLNIFERPLELGDSSPLASFHLHLAGMWVNFILTAVLIAVFGLLTRRAMLKQQKQIQLMREKHLQDEQILGLGIMSASAAHELGTPLSTMAIIIDDLQHAGFSGEQQRDMLLLGTQIDSCKKIIGALSEKSRDAQQQLSKHLRIDESEQSENFKTQLQAIVERWLVYRPGIRLEQKWKTDLSSYRQNISISLEQAVTNLLDNAADASLDNDNDNVELIIDTDDKTIFIDIYDFGQGISADKKQTFSTRIQPSNKQDGLGWGMFLSNVSIERVGGSVQLLENNPDGTLTRILLPKGKMS